MPGPSGRFVGSRVFLLLSLSARVQWPSDRGSHVSDMTPDSSVDVSGWEDKDSIHTDSSVLIDLDRPIDLTGHVLSAFYL